MQRIFGVSNRGKATTVLNSSASPEISYSTTLVHCFYKQQKHQDRFQFLTPYSQFQTQSATKLNQFCLRYFLHFTHRIACALSSGSCHLPVFMGCLMRAFRLVFLSLLDTATKLMIWKQIPITLCSYFATALHINCHTTSTVLFISPLSTWLSCRHNVFHIQNIFLWFFT